MPLPLIAMGVGALAPSLGRAIVPRIAGGIFRAFGGRLGLGIAGASAAAPTVFRRLAGTPARAIATGAGAGALATLGLQESGNPFGGGGGGEGLQVGGPLPDGHTIVKVWSTNGQYNDFGRLADGRGVAVRRDGTIKTFRYKRHIVLSSDPSVRQLLRADKAIQGKLKGLRKAVNRKR